MGGLEIHVFCSVCKRELNIQQLIKKDGDYFQRTITEDGHIFTDPCSWCTENFHQEMVALVRLVDRYREQYKDEVEEEADHE
jgi:hypothetical protein